MPKNVERGVSSRRISKSHRGRGLSGLPLAAFLKRAASRIASKSGMLLPNFLSPLQVPHALWSCSSLWDSQLKEVLPCL